MDDPGSPLFGSIILILTLTAVNAFLAGAEMAFVSLNPAKIKEMADNGDKRATKVQKLLATPDAFLSAIQVGITFAGFFNSASAARTFVDLIMPALGGIPAAETVASLIVTLIISYVTLVLGELYPKQLALQMPEQYARVCAGTILFIRGAFKPFVWLLTVSVGLVKKLTPIDFSKKEEKLTRHEIRVLLNSSRNDGAIDAEEFNMMRGVLSLDTRLVREIMVPRVDTDMLDAEDPIEKNMDLMLTLLRSRIPLYEEDKDNIIGIVHLKDVLLNLAALNEHRITLREIARPAMFIPDTMYTDELLVQFQQSKQHLAVLVDEFGGVSGIVTLEDLIEEIVGDIKDEYDDDEGQPLQIISDREAILLGSLPLTDVNRTFNLNIESQDADTIAGYVIEKLGYLPKPGEEPEVARDDFTLRVLRTKNTRIELVRLTLPEPPAGPADADEDSAG
ncbi:MAG TPA: hemolysin family protein [Clostridia bacterium]|jgi:putative hemolysin|nr:hemolysin family protein [Clostridia bacterium]HQA98196.1 hemolysin family protein [Clostridia bacterium]HQO56310.1 hemolysin family protein [Clostridia bacterium]HUM60104.1 hemolysin family protein [Clostridia bacterium]